MPATNANPEYIAAAKAASALAYVPYSHFHVGAALITAQGSVIQGCNIENASFGLTNCAERTAFFKALSEGVKDFSALYIYGAEANEPISPCGACRQVMREFCAPDMPVILISKTGETLDTTVEGLLPYSFTALS